LTDSQKKKIDAEVEKILASDIWYCNNSYSLVRG
jgi:hypothetical protein